MILIIVLQVKYVVVTLDLLTLMYIIVNKSRFNSVAKSMFDENTSNIIFFCRRKKNELLMSVLISVKQPKKNLETNSSFDFTRGVFKELNFKEKHDLTRVLSVRVSPQSGSKHYRK